MTTQTTPAETASGLNQEHLLTALQAAARPESAAWVRQQLPKLLQASVAEIERLLHEALDAGQVWRFGKADKPLYWHSSPKAWVQQSLQQRLTREMKSQSEVCRPVSQLATVQGLVPRTGVDSAFRELVAEGRIQKHPAYLGSRTPLYSVRAVDPVDYLKHAIEKLALKLSVGRDELAGWTAKVTFDEPVPSAVTPAAGAIAPIAQSPLPMCVGPQALPHPVPASTALSDAELILQAMHEINPQVATGDVVSLVEVRKRLDFQFDKATFDRTILQLAADWKIALQRDDHSHWRTDAERDALVQDEHGKYYNVVSLRKHS